MNAAEPDDYGLFRRRLCEAHTETDELAAMLLDLHRDPFNRHVRKRARAMLEQRKLLKPLDNRTCAERRRDRDRALRLAITERTG